MPMKRKNSKDILDYNASDLTQTWCDEYRKKYKEPYKLLQSDIGKIHRLAEIYGNYEMMLCIKKSIEDGDRSIGYFESKITKYISDSDYAKYYYIIESRGTKVMKNLLVELSVLEARFLPSAVSQSRMEEIILEFDEFINVKS